MTRQKRQTKASVHYVNNKEFTAAVIAHNEASLNLYVGKCGWVEEGRKKKAMPSGIGFSMGPGMSINIAEDKK